MKEKLKLERPPLGELSRVRIQETDRPKPLPAYKLHPEKLPEAPKLSDAHKYPEALDSIKRTKGTTE